MLLNQNTNNNYTARQLKLPLEIEKLIDISDPVYTFCEVMDHIDLSGYFGGEKNVILELTLISCGFNLYKYHNKKQRQMKVACFNPQPVSLRRLITEQNPAVLTSCQ